MVQISDTYEKITEIAETARRRCKYGVAGSCENVSLDISTMLADEGIQHRIAIGEWIDDDEHPYKGPLLHVWIEFPDGTILDATADQFGDLPEIWFPADLKHYRFERYLSRPHGISGGGPRRRPRPLRAAKVAVRRHVRRRR